MVPHEVRQDCDVWGQSWGRSDICKLSTIDMSGIVQTVLTDQVIHVPVNLHLMVKKYPRVLENTL